MDIDTGNHQMVGVFNDNISVMLPKQEMTKDEALVHAAWLVTLADPLSERFEQVLEAVQLT